MKVNRDRESRTIFVGPSIGASLICCIPLVCLKLLGILELSWIWILCPLWLGWAVVFLVWLWFSTISCITRSIASVALRNSAYLACLESGVEPEDNDGKDGAESNGM